MRKLQKRISLQNSVNQDILKIIFADGFEGPFITSEYMIPTPPTAARNKIIPG